jgi:hypothetical protein
VVVMDIRMPVLDGIAATHRMSATASPRRPGPHPDHLRCRRERGQACAPVPAGSCSGRDPGRFVAAIGPSPRATPSRRPSRAGCSTGMPTGCHP